MGWFTCHPVFAEKFQRQSETSTQQPCGFGQVFLFIFCWGPFPSLMTVIVYHHRVIIKLEVHRLLKMAEGYVYVFLHS